jgi:hypothetical protein
MQTISVYALVNNSGFVEFHFYLPYRTSYRTLIEHYFSDGLVGGYLASGNSLAQPSDLDAIRQFQE